MQYRQKLLYDKARSLLEHTQLSIKEIAFQLGFDTQNYFSRAFKNQQGVSPAQFRNQVQEASSEESSE
jgi:AraC-like DNA-binding protein